MLFSSCGHLVATLIVSSAFATPVKVALPLADGGLDLVIPKIGGLLTDTTHVNININKQWASNEALIQGHVVADIDLAPLSEVAADVEVDIICKECYIKGDIDATVSLEHVAPALRLSLSGIEAYLHLQVDLSAAALVAVNLYTPVKPIEIPLLGMGGLKVVGLVHVDLILGVEAAISLEGGVWVEMVEDAIIDTDILQGTILSAAVSGLGVKVIPIKVKTGCTLLHADLRIRVQAGIQADVDLGALLPIDIGVGAALGVYVNLIEYVALVCDTPRCPVSRDSWSLNIGAAVGIDVDVKDIAAIALAPTISTILLAAPTASHCEHGARPSGPVKQTVVLSTASPSATHSATIVPPRPSRPVEQTVTIGTVTHPVNTISHPATTSAATLPPGYTTSTVYATMTYTITSCAANVINCPAKYQYEQTVVKTVDVYTTVCPITASLPTAKPTPSISFSTFSAKPSVVIVTTDITTLVSCSSVETFTPPASLSTVPAHQTSHPSLTFTKSYPLASLSSGHPAGSTGVSYPAGSSSDARGSTSNYAAADASSCTADVASTSVVSFSPSAVTLNPAYPTYPGGADYSTSRHEPTIPGSTTFVKPTASGSYTVSPYPSGMVTAGAGKVGSGVAGAMVIAAAVAAII